MFSSPNFGAANKPFGDFKVPDQGSNDQLVPYHDRGREREREKDEGEEEERDFGTQTELTPPVKEIPRT